MKAVKMIVASALACALAAGCGTALAETEYEWSIDLDCSICHQTQVDSLTSATDEAPAAEPTKDDAKADLPEPSKVDGFAVMHYEKFNVTCTTCHVDSDGLTKGHKKLNSGKESTKLKKSQPSVESCQTCHKAEDLAKATEACELVVDEKGTVVNPHALPENTSHEQITCTSCHAVHEADARIAKDAVSYCVSCHHEQVFECGTCHA